MREILFRGKRMDNGEWITGDLVHDRRVKTNEPVLCIWYFDSDGKAQQEDINPETVGQYTGLEDKNGRKIFDGDIVEGLDYTAEDGGYGVIGFVEGAFEVSGNDICGTFYENYWGKDFEVIGNVHDNPELVGGAE